MEIAPVLNWLFSNRNKVLTPYLDLELLHLTGPTKPWNDPLRTLPAIVRATYAGFARDGDGSATPLPDTVRLSHLVKHLRDRNRYAAWLRRFSDKCEGILAKPFGT